MTRIAIGLGVALAWALAACGGHDEAQQAARQAKERTQVTVESAPQAGAPMDQAAKERTQVTVESAEMDKKPAEE